MVVIAIFDSVYSVFSFLCSCDFLRFICVLVPYIYLTLALLSLYVNKYTFN